MDSDLMDRVQLVAGYLPGMLRSCLIALEVAVLSIGVSWLSGLIAALCKNARIAALRAPAQIYIWFMRGTPPLMQLFIVYFGVRQLGLGLPPFLAGVLALGIGSGAYVAEILRSGLSAIPKGQWESSLAMGMGHVLVLRRIILPQVVRIIVPALGNEAINTLKNTSLLSTITLVELTLYAQSLIASTYRPFDFYIVAALLYLAMTSIVSTAVVWYERRFPLHV